jgi:hypothetical protein
MGERDSRLRRRQRSAERARRVPLDNGQGDAGQMRQRGARDFADMMVRIGTARTVEKSGVEAAETEVGRIDRMLAGQEQGRRETEASERFSDGCELYGFGARADDQRDFSAAQLPP